MSDQPNILECTLSQKCGGCPLMGRPYRDQLSRKRARVHDLLERWQELVEPCLRAPAVASYRNRAKLAVRIHRGQVRLGLFRRGSNEVVDLAPCRVQSTKTLEGLEALRVGLAEQHLAAPAGPVFYVDVRETVTGECHATLVVDGELVEEVLARVHALGDVPGLSGIAVNIGHPKSSYPLGLETTVVVGGKHIEMALARTDITRSFLVPPTGFFQVAPGALQPVHDAIATFLRDEGPLLDLYCGVGVHGLVVGALQEARPVVGIESSAALIEAARENAARSTQEATFHTAKVEDALEEIVACGAREAVLNPGRAGCKPAVLDTLNGASLERLAYLSCNPVTLARDLSVLTKRFEIHRIAPVDLMPQTAHVETLVLLRRTGESMRASGTRRVGS